MTMDSAITLWVNSFSGADRLLDGTMIAVTRFGVPALVAIVVVQWWSRSGRDQVRHACIASALSMLGALAVNQIVLLFVHRIRPYDAGLTHLIISRSADWSFPSDHAAASFSIAIAFALQGLRRRALLFGAIAILICWSRLYVGTHYLTDVLGGIVAAALAVVVVRWAYREGTPMDRFLTRLL